MRYVTADMTWERGELHPLMDEIERTADVDLEANHYINPLGDGTNVELLEFTGATETLRDILERSSSVRRYEISDEDSQLVFLHFESTQLLETFIDAALENTLVIQWPVRYITDTGNSGIRVTLLGTDDAFNSAFEDLPAVVDISLVRTGEYTAGTTNPTQTLTAKQQTLLEEAIRMGYYEIPREATQDDLAEKLDVSRGTLSDRLRRLEATIIKSLAE